MAGKCIYARNCVPIVQILEKRPLSVADRIYLARSQCGYRNNQPLVCCQQDYTPATKPPPRPTRPTVRPTGSILPEPGSGKCGLSYAVI